MGYCSDVALAVTSELNEKVTELLNQVKEESMLKHPERVVEKEGAVLYFWNRIKWDTFGDDERTLENILLEDESDNYSFVRIGDESEDIEQMGYLDSPFELGVTVSIDMNIDI